MKNQPGALPSKPLVDEPRELPNLKLVPPDEESAIWSPPPVGDGPLTTSQVLHVPIEPVRRDFEARIIEVIRRDRHPDESHATSGANREAELRAILAELDAVEAFHLRRRLESARADDPLCATFQRLVVERRHRLLQFLGDPRRRAANARRR